MRAALGFAAALAVTACAEDPVVTPMTLDLVDDAPECVMLQVGTIRSVEVMAVGATDAGADCRLDRACIEVSLSVNVDALEDQLAAAPQPVLDVETDQLVRVWVRGFDAQGCGGTLRLCGIADTDAAVAGRLGVPVVCDTRLADRCPADDLPACP